MRHSKKTFITSAILICAVALLAIPTRAQSLDAAKEKQKELEGSLKEARELVNSLEGTYSDVESKIIALDKELEAIERESAGIEEEMAAVQKRLEDNEQSILDMEAEMEKRRQEMEIRIIYTYENGRNNMINHLFSSGDYMGFMRAIDYCMNIQEFDNMVLMQYEDSLKKLNAAKEAIAADKERLLGLSKENEEQSKAMSVVMSAREQELSKLDGELTDAKTLAAAYEAEVKAQNEVLAQIQKAIAAQEAARKAAEEKARLEAEEAARRAAEEEAKRQAAIEEAKANGDDVEKVIEEFDKEAEERAKEEEKNKQEEVKELPKTAGSFTWPCPSSKRITSEYGPRTSPTAGASSDHKGIDIGAPEGSAIVAAESGEVILSTYSSSAGNYIIINHGVNDDGVIICSVYMHCSKLIAIEGDMVTRGQTIAEVGSTGISTGNHLHFGVTEDGSYVSPWNYL